MVDRNLLVPAIMSAVMALGGEAAGKEQGCIACHRGIEDFATGVMQETIEGMGAAYGDPAGCVVCRGGDPEAATAEAAHKGAPAALTEMMGPEMFYPDPGSVWIASRTCGQCHQGYAERLTKSLMNTEAGKLQGNLWSWGLQNDDGHKVVGAITTSRTRMGSNRASARTTIAPI